MKRGAAHALDGRAYVLIWTDVSNTAIRFEKSPRALNRSCAVPYCVPQDKVYTVFEGFSWSRGTPRFYVQMTIRDQGAKPKRTPTPYSIGSFNDHLCAVSVSLRQHLLISGVRTLPVPRLPASSPMMVYA